MREMEISLRNFTLFSPNWSKLIQFHKLTKKTWLFVLESEFEKPSNASFAKCYLTAFSKMTRKPLLHSKWFERSSVSCSACVIERMRVVLKGTAVQLVTSDVSVTWAGDIFRAKWIKLVNRCYYKSGPLIFAERIVLSLSEDIGKFSSFDPFFC